MFKLPSCGNTQAYWLVIFVLLHEHSKANGSGRVELTIVSATTVKQALWSSGDKREKFLSHQALT